MRCGEVFLGGLQVQRAMIMNVKTLEFEPRVPTGRKRRWSAEKKVSRVLFFWRKSRAIFFSVNCVRKYGNKYQPPPPRIGCAKVPNSYSPYAYCSLDKAVAYATHTTTDTHVSARKV